jgi:5-methylcytosine-specific restriction endonuclease McrA
MVAPCSRNKALHILYETACRITSCSADTGAVRFMGFEEYIAQIENRPGHRPLSAVKRAILERLWSGDWVTSAGLLELTSQKYFDRRIRELRDETGCDIETGRHDGQHAYRLVSTGLSGGNTRKYLGARQKKELFSRYRYKCAVCRRELNPGDSRIQADHKVPLIRGGSHNERNWQLLCVECNVSKRGACAGCKLNCQECPWAYPEKYESRLIIIPIPYDKAVNSWGSRSRA